MRRELANVPRVVEGREGATCCSEGARTKMGFVIRDVRGGGSEASRSSLRTVGPKLGPEGWGVKEVRMRKDEDLDGIAGMDLSREMGNGAESSGVAMDTSRERFLLEGLLGGKVGKECGNAETGGSR